MYDGQLRAVIASYEEGSFSKASQRIYLSTPALKKEIDTLERELHVILFHRSNRGLKPTEAGESFYRYCKQAIRSLDDEIARLHEIQSKSISEIRIGYDNSLVRDCIFNYAVYEFRQEYPFFVFESSVCDFFDSDRFDVFFGANRTNRNDLCTHSLCDLPLVCLVPVDHPLAVKKEVALSELAKASFIFPPKEMLAYTEPNILNDLQAFPIQYLPLNAIGTISEQMSLVQGKPGVIIGFEEQTNKKLVQIPLKGYSFHYELCTFKGNHKPAVMQFVHFMQGYYPNKAAELLQELNLS